MSKALIKCRGKTIEPTPSSFSSKMNTSHFVHPLSEESKVPQLPRNEIGPFHP